jgi:hypothetical protein
MNKGYQHLFSCYNHGIDQLNAIFRQDVLHIEAQIIHGCHACNKVSYKSQNLQEKYSKKKRKQK